MFGNKCISSALFERANTWLKANPQWKVISCESLESKLKSGSTVDTNKSTYEVNGKFETTYNRSLRYVNQGFMMHFYHLSSKELLFKWAIITALSVVNQLRKNLNFWRGLLQMTHVKTFFEDIILSRLWVCNKTPADNPEPQQLRYVNLVPKCTASGGLTKPKFENFTSTIERFNEQIASEPIQGIYSGFSQIHKIGNNDNIANFVYLYNCSFLSKCEIRCQSV